MSAPTVALRPREVQILHGLAGGLSIPQIARQIHISKYTAKSHADSLYRKLGASTQAHAVAIAYRAGLLGAGFVALALREYSEVHGLGGGS